MRFIPSTLRVLAAAAALTSCLLAGCASAKANEAVFHTFAEYGAWADTYLEAHVAECGPGVVALLFDREHAPTTMAHGCADPARRTPMRPDTIFQVASISKTATTYGVLTLVEKAAVDLDAPVKRYLTRYVFPPSRWDRDAVTVRRLASHTAGLSVTGYPGFAPGRELPSIEESLAGDAGLFFGFFSPGPVRIVHAPGSRWDYSGGGYTVLQLMVEEVSGKAFSGYMEEAVFGPLGMASSTLDHTAVDRGRLAVGHDRWGRPQPNYLFTEKAAAGLYSTASDLEYLLRDLAAGVAGERALLPSELYQEITTEQAVVAGPVSMGLGFHIEHLPGGTRLAFHYGGNQGWQSFCGVNLERGEGLVLLTNTDQGIDLLIDPVIRGYRRFVAGQADR